MGIDPGTLIYVIPAIIIGLTIHEFSHGYAALLLGDTTAKSDGRISLNPIKHIDPIGMLVLIIAGFGWAKPVRFNPGNLHNPRRDRILISIAGPLSNLVIGVTMLLLIKFILKNELISNPNTLENVFNMLFYIATINLGLFVFNMIPIPPLDGSHVLFSTINLSSEMESRIYKYGSLALLVIIIMENNLELDILPIGKFINFIIGLIFG